MQTLNYWKQFENTGKIQDYLSYKGCVQDRQTGRGDRTEDCNCGTGTQPAGSEAVCRNSYT